MFIVLRRRDTKESVFDKMIPVDDNGRVLDSRPRGRGFEPHRYPFKNIFDFTTAGDWDCVAAVERLPALHYLV